VQTLIVPTDLDRRLGFPRGRAAKLAARGLIPHLELPDGEIRFDPDAVEQWLRERSHPAESEPAR